MPTPRMSSLSEVPRNFCAVSLRRVLILSALLGACGGQGKMSFNFESAIAQQRSTNDLGLTPNGSVSIATSTPTSQPISSVTVAAPPPQPKKVMEQKMEGDLDVFRRDIAAKDEGGRVKAEAEKLQNNPELGDGSKYVIVGDSAANGMHQSYAEGKRPSFIGKDGMTTYGALNKLIEHEWKLKNKEKVIIYCGGNSILRTNPDIMKGHMIKMARISHDAGVPDIIVNTQFPPDPRWVKALGSEYGRFKRRNAEFRELLLEAYEKEEFPKGVRVVDLFAPFADENGMMKKEYVSRKSADYLHPWPAYAPALELMLRPESKKNGGGQVYSD